MACDADGVHLGQPHADVVLRAGQRQRRPRADAADPGVEPHHAVGHAGEIGEPLVGEALQQGQRHRVRVHVERACAPTGRASCEPLTVIVSPPGGPRAHSDPDAARWANASR